jgi:hypothetical protein
MSVSKHYWAEISEINSPLSRGIDPSLLFYLLPPIWKKISLTPYYSIDLCLLQNPVIPPTITDQIRLWELERNRFKFTDGVLYSQFLSQADFELLRDYAKVMNEWMVNFLPL